MSQVPSRRRPRAVVAVLLATVLAAAVLQACGGDDAEAATFTREPAGEAGANPFMEGVDTAPSAATASMSWIGDPVASTTTPPTTAAPSTTAASTPPPTVTLPPSAGGVVSGDTTGLYGGSGNRAVCDAGKLVAFLSTHPAEATAWAGVLGIEPGAIESYVATLTATTLRTDTAVTNHGFSDGRATAVPAVLQAGTAVFVDDRGVPVVKCNCGNPLTTPPSRTAARFTGTSWSGFSPSGVATVRPSPEPMPDLVLVDPGTSTAITRPIGTDGDADVPYTGPTPGDAPDGDGSEDATTTTGSSDDGPTSSTSSSTSTTSTSAPDAGLGDVVVDGSSNGVGGACAGVPGATGEIRISGGTITFSTEEHGAINPDGTFDFTVERPVEGGLGATISTHFVGRVDTAAPWGFTASRTDTITSPTGATDTCEVAYTGVRRDATAETTTTEAPTTTAPTTTTTAPPATPTDQTWYFEARIDDVADGCEDLGITVARDGVQRIRVRDGGSDGHTVTFLGRPSMTFPVSGDEFDGVLLPGTDDQLQVSVRGGPVPYLGVTRARPFQYASMIGDVASIPGTFSRTACFVRWTAEPA